MNRIQAWAQRIPFQKWQWILTPLLIFLITRLGIFLAAYLGNILFASDPAQLHTALRPDPAILGLLSRYDSEWYIKIAISGYNYSAQQFSSAAFFPLYPILIRGFSFFLGHNLYLAGLLISSACFLGGVLFFYRLVEELYADSEMAKRAVLYLCLFPSGVFFAAIYTESLFFFTVIGCVYFARKRNWLLSAVFGAAASATRSLGVLVLLWAGWEWLQAIGWQWKMPFKLPRGEDFRKHRAGIAALALIPAGLAAFMLYLWQAFGDPLVFIYAQAGWKQQMIGPFLVVQNYIQRLISEPGYEYAPVFDYSLILLAILLAALPQIAKRLGFGAFVFCVACVLIPFSSSLFSLHRIILPLFPLCMILAEWGGKHRWVDTSIRVVFPMLLAVFTIAFTNWRLFF